MAKSSIQMSENEIEAMEASMLGQEDDEDNAAANADEKAAAPAVSDRKPKVKDPEFEFEGPTDDAKVEGEKKPVVKQTVDIGALHAEREERKRAQQSLEQERLSRVRLEERLGAMHSSLQQFAQQREQQQTQQQQPDLPPDPEADPMGAIAWQQREIGRLRQAEAARQQQGQQVQAQTAEQQRVAQEWNTAYQAVSTYFNNKVAEDPTIQEAYDALLTSYTGELQALGYNGPQLQQELQNIEQRHIMNAFRNNIAIDKLVVSLAQARVGWKPKSEEERAAAAEAAASGTQQLARLSAAKEASTSLSTSGGGKTGGNKLSLEALDRMPQKDFEKMIATLSKRGESAIDDALAKMEGVSR